MSDVTYLRKGGARTQPALKTTTGRGDLGGTGPARCPGQAGGGRHPEDKVKALPPGHQPDPPGPPTSDGNNRGAPCAVVALHGGIKVKLLAEKDKTLMTRCGQASR